MSIVFISPGNINDFDATSNVTQITNAYEHTRGKHGICFSCNSTTTGYVKKTLSAAAEYWVAMMVSYDQLTGNDQDCLFAFYNGATRLARVKRTGNLLQFIQDTSTILGETGSNSYMDVSTRILVEAHYKRDATAGVAQIWINGELKLDFSGNTGAAANIDSINFGGYRNTGSYARYSDIAIDNAQRIGDKPVYALLPVAAGNQQNWDCSQRHLGHISTGTGNAATTGWTFVCSNPAKANGNVEKIVIQAGAAGDVKIFGIRRLASGNFDSVAGVTLTCISGLNTFVAGTDFTAFALQAGDYIGAVSSVAGLLRTVTSASTFFDDGQTFELYATTDKSASTNFALNVDSGKYLLLEAYQTAPAAASGYSLVGNSIASAAKDLDWLETNVADEICDFQFSTLPQGDIGAITAIMTILRAKYEGASSILHIAPTVKSGSNTYAGSDVALTTAFANIFTTNNIDPATGVAWTAAGINAARFGAKSRT